MTKPILTNKRIVTAYAIAIIADLIELPITAAELTGFGAPVAEGFDFFIDVVVFGAMYKLLGFHWMLLPSFCVEVIPGLDLLPTWVGCVWVVVRQRKKESSFKPAAERKIINELNVIDV
jgi:hypothetical protein